MKRLVRLLLGGIASVALTAWPLAARTSPVSGATLLGDGWRVIAGDKSEVTSDCIGQMTSPLCVVDTMMACDVWSPAHDYDNPMDAEAAVHPICKGVSTGNGPRTFNLGSTNPKYYRLEYQVATFPVTAENITGARVFIPRYPYKKGEADQASPLPGDLAVIVHFRWFAPPDDCIISPLNKVGMQLYRDGCALTDSAEGYEARSPRTAILRQDSPGGEWRTVVFAQPYRDNTWPALTAIYGATIWRK